MSEEVWRDAVVAAWSGIRTSKDGKHSPAQIEKEKRRYERIYVGGLPEWQERGEWAGFKFPKPR
jgi:hypothetical protein